MPASRRDEPRASPRSGPAPLPAACTPGARPVPQPRGPAAAARGAPGLRSPLDGNAETLQARRGEASLKGCDPASALAWELHAEC